jgi:proteasome accessory factor B
MPSDHQRIHRLLRILTLIQGSGGWTARKLAEEFGTTTRTIYRDMKILDAAGIPYFHDVQTQGYSINRTFFLPPVSLSFEEALALVALAHQVGGKEQIPFTRQAGRAIEKVRGQLPSPVREQLERVIGHVSLKLAAATASESAQDVYDRVRQAIATGTQLRCAYQSLSRPAEGDSGGAGEFYLKPYELLFNQRAWYVVGHHSRHNQVRCMRLSRFTQITPTERKYKIPRDFSLEKHLGNAWRMIRGETTYDVELRFDPEFADTIADTHWHATQQVEWQEDDSIIFRCRVDGLDEIVWWVLSMGPHCRVIAPVELRRRVRDLATGVAKLYSTDV